MIESDKIIEFIVEGLQEKKAKNIVVADMTEIEDAAFKYFVICEGNSTTQVNSIGENVIDFVRKNANIRPFGYDGFKNCQWIAVDYADILVHIFLPETRDFYKIEQLWSDAKLTQFENLD